MIDCEVITEFDPAPAQERLGSGVVRAFMRLGAYIRQNMRSRLRYDKKSSRPGEAPRVHRNPSPLRERMVFGMPDPLSVVVGPALSSGKSGEAVAALEEGGVSTTTDGHTIHLQPRPFMKPAFFEESMKASSYLEDALSA